MKREEDEELAMEFSKGQNDAQIDIFRLPTFYFPCKLSPSPPQSTVCSYQVNDMKVFCD